MQALREALQVEPEKPVAWLRVSKDGIKEEAVVTEHSRRSLERGGITLTPLYTTPPSIDALIAEIESIVTCAETVTDRETGDTIYIGEAYPEDDVKEVLDKYRSKP